jgi:hypothetical protein
MVIVLSEGLWPEIPRGETLDGPLPQLQAEFAATIRTLTAAPARNAQQIRCDILCKQQPQSHVVDDAQLRPEFAPLCVFAIV